MHYSFSIESFRHPEAIHSPGYFWKINAPFDLAQLKAQLKDMYDHGARSVCLHPLPHDFRADIHTDMSPEYLSEKFFECIEELVRECKRLGMNYYLYDEGGWPSGSACGQVCKAGHGRFDITNVWLDENGNAKIMRRNYGNGHSPTPNIQENGAAQKFIELTHEKYARHISEHFGDTVNVVFTDEAAALCIYKDAIDWCSDFADVFKAKKGYDITPYLAEIIKLRKDAKAWNEKTLDNPLTFYVMDFNDVCAELYLERFLLPIRDWCRRHNLRSGGHLSGEDEWANGMLKGGYWLKSLRTMDVPGVDAIWRQIFKGSLNLFPKLASSAANQSGNPQVMTEAFAVYGTGLTLGQMKYVIDFMLFCGVNTFIFAHYPQTMQGARMSYYRPFFGEKYFPQWECMTDLHAYTERLSYLMACGRPYVKTAVYFNQRMLGLGGELAKREQESLLESCDALLQKQCDFDFVDDEVLLNGVLQDGALCFGEAKYENLLVPELATLSQSIVSRIAELRQAGISEEIAPLLKITPNVPELRLRMRDFGDGRIGCFFFNTGDSTIRFSVDFPSEIALAEPMTGEFKQTANEITLGPAETKFIVCGVSVTVECENACEDSAKMRIDGKWQLRPTRQFVMTPDDYVQRLVDSPAIDAELGDWRQYLGDDFSGDGVYSIIFNCDAPEQFRWLDLGDVRYAASVKLNGVDLGRKAWAPYRFALRNALRKGENVLEITVTNTLANIFTEKAQHYLDVAYPPKSRYADYEMQFEAESKSSGLFGTVKLASSI